MKKQKKEKYEPPTVRIIQVVLESGLAETVIISASARLLDWEDGGELGGISEEGGDIYLTF